MGVKIMITDVRCAFLVLGAPEEFKAGDGMYMVAEIRLPQSTFERAGTGVAMGQYWMGPFVKMGGNPAYPMQVPSSISYTRNDFSGYWGYVPPEE